MPTCVWSGRCKSGHQAGVQRAAALCRSARCPRKTPSSPPPVEHPLWGRGKRFIQHVRQKSTWKSPCITPMGHGEVAIFAVYYLWMSKYQKGTLMRITLRLLLLPSVLFIFVLSACGSQQQPTHAQAQAPAPRFSCTSTSVTSFLSHINRQNTAGHNSAQAASTQHMHMGPHMKMTSFQQPTSGDIAYANAIMQIARQCLAKYTDYKLALQDGYRIFEPDVLQDIYHFASVQNFVEAQTKFNPLHT